VQVTWIVRSRYRGPLLIRGRQLDGTRVLHFEHGQIPGTERWIPRARSRKSSERRYSSRTRLRAPGCYAYQVDGLGFSRVFVFEAKTSGPGTVDEIVSALRTRGLPMEQDGLFHSFAFGYFLGGLARQRFENPAGEVILWQFISFTAVHQLLIVGSGQSIEVVHQYGRESAAIFCCPYWDVPPPHWYRNGSALALYLGSDAAMLKTMEELLGEQFAGA